MNAVADFGQVAANVAPQLAALYVSKALELFDEINFELGAILNAKLKGNVLMCIGAATSACFGDQAESIGVRPTPRR